MHSERFNHRVDAPLSAHPESECIDQLAQGGGESLGQHSGQVDIVVSGHGVDSFARVTLDGLSKNHAMTFNHSATTRR